MSTQDERRLWLIKALLAERGERLEIPSGTQTQNQLLRALLNVRPPVPAKRGIFAEAYALLRQEDFPVLRIGSCLVVPKEKFLVWAEEQTGGNII